MIRVISKKTYQKTTYCTLFNNFLSAFIFTLTLEHKDYVFCGVNFDGETWLCKKLMPAA